MNLRELELFKHLALSLHFGRTSIECNITRSALTRTIQRLENSVGKPLFFRNNRSVSLTPAGILFREYCEDTLSRWRLLQNHLQSDALLRGELSLYSSVTAILSILPQILNRFRKIHPGVKVHIQTGDAAKALQKLQTREVDIAIAAVPDKKSEQFEYIELLKTPLVFIQPKSSIDTIVYQNQKIDWTKTPLILPSVGVSRTRGEKWFDDRGIEPYIYSEVAGNEAIIAMVSMGCGVGIVPRLVLEKNILKEEVKILNVTPQLKPFTVGSFILSNTINNPIIEAFWHIIESELKQPIKSYENDSTHK